MAAPGRWLGGRETWRGIFRELRLVAQSFQTLLEPRLNPLAVLPWSSLRQRQLPTAAVQCHSK
jgi:hypothetical protein